MIMEGESVRDGKGKEIIYREKDGGRKGEIV